MSCTSGLSVSGAAAAVFAAALAPVVIASVGDRAPLPALRWPVAVIAHRGGAGIAPENTLAAIRQAIRLKADYVEVDVRTTKDGELVIMHDSAVDRTTNGTGNVRDLTLAEIRALKVKNAFGASFKDQSVPTFDEVLALCRGKVNVYLDHKDGDTARILDALRKRRMERSVVVYGGVDGLRKWKELAPAIPIMPSLPGDYRRPGGIAEFASVCPAEVLDGHVTAWTKELVADAHAAGIKVYVDIMGPTDTPGGYAAALALGVDGIQTDHPDALIAYLRARGRTR